MGSAKTCAGDLMLVCRLATSCCSPGDNVWQPWLGVVLGVTARERERKKVLVIEKGWCSGREKNYEW